MAVLRIDGFCSRDAGADPGLLVTRPFRTEGRRLTVNADIKERGYIRVSILDKTGQPLKPFSGRACLSLEGDRVDHVVGWRDQPDLAEVAGQTICLRFDCRNANLYSYRVK